VGEPFLILHRVRGEPAFDIAVKLEIADEEAWIIPTSGHRAYPVWDMPLDPLIVALEPPNVPDNWPDHYPTKATKSLEPAGISSLLTKLGLGPKPIKRRI
jgi:hypothetical protein